MWQALVVALDEPPQRQGPRWLLTACRRQRTKRSSTTDKEVANDTLCVVKRDIMMLGGKG